MRVCVLYCSDEVSQEGVPAPARAPIELAEYGPRHAYAYYELTKTTAVRALKKLAGRGFDVFLNLCDGAWDEARPGIEVVAAMERLELPFTGAGTAFYEPSREVMKLACHYLDIPCPRGLAVRGADQSALLTSRFRFPLIVKHPNSYNSIGLTPASRVQTLGELEEQIDRMTDGFGGALVEEFVEGREFTVLVTAQADPRSRVKAYPPVECVLPPGETFKHYDLKWRDYRLLQWRAVTDDGLARQLMRISADLFQGLGGSGYARCDIRVASTGIPYVLEINPNCSVFYPPDAPGGADAVLQNIPAAMRISSRRSSLTPWPVSAPTGGVMSWSSALTKLATGCTPPRRLRPGNGSAAARSSRTRWSPADMRRRTGQRGSSTGSNSTDTR